MLQLSLAALQSAAEITYRQVLPTPQINWPLLSERCGCQVWVKHENHNLTGAFKVRGGLVYMHRLRQREPACPGVITATRGNHGQSVALAAGTCVPTDSADTFADGLAVRVPNPDALALMQGNIEQIVSVSDEEISQAMAWLFTDTHNVAEGAGAAALAALYKQRELNRGCRVGVVLSGGNVDASLYARVLSQQGA
ncbi:pyridoxal-phosphate dependent enzyme [Seongchinamella sediminis]|uniref:Pyridoxal-phosphate dependent enzyme n=1 Tax=Seongchinamella sediminis TaxID=2283635 RepID=A0A3L7DUU3_9GAMM|nr:pyridoxal-phosphate dependent enzyme [Seongchinamella sediminis]RLQ21328.1 pyridoxal-phosphate dependent enzyme [Seongchinamella sediminis]